MSAPAHDDGAYVKANLRYAAVVARHKWFVLRAGLKVGGIPFYRLLIHDWSKLTPAEWGPYVRRFFGGRAGEMNHDADPQEFHNAFRHHWQRNPHHWEFWCDGDSFAYPMDEKYAREMVADWMGASRAYTGKWDVQEWYAKNRERISLHPDTRSLVDGLVASNAR
jgi:hypothetical protein